MTAYYSDKKQDKKRVVITGFGAVTPLGNSIVESWRNLVQGKSGIGEITVFDASKYPVKIAAEVKNFDFTSNIPEDMHPFVGRSTQFCIAAAREALAHAGITTENQQTPHIGISLGSNEEGMYLSHWERLYESKTVKQLLEMRKDNPPSTVPSLHLASASQLGRLWQIRKAASTAASILSILFNIQGPVRTSTGACASSAQAIGKAMRLIQDGDAEIVLAGGCDSMLSEFCIAGFHRLRALSRNNENPEKASRPFDLKRDGFVLGEGSGMLVLEELSHARKRNAVIYGELVGYGSSSNAYSITASPEDGRGADLCIKAALRDAGCSIEDIDYINAHGTSTYLNDKSETAAIKNVFKDRAYEIPVSSNKSMLGHLIASVAAIELIMSVMTINEQLIPPTINYEHPDPECDLDYVPNEPRCKRVETILSNSFAFGGQNASVLVKKYQ